MNIPSKIAKSNLLLAERVIEHQSAASKYFKQYSKIRKTKETQTSEANKEKKNLKEEIISWFFSLDLITKLIISSIENKWVTNLLQQLYIQQKHQPGVKFQMKEGDLVSPSGQVRSSGVQGNEISHQILRLNLTEDTSNICNQIVTNNFFANECSSTLNSTCSNSSSNGDLFNYLTYFKETDVYNPTNFDNFMHKTNAISTTQENFLNEIKFYKSEELLLGGDSNKLEKYSNYFTLSEKILQDEKQFRLYFDTLSKDQAFSHLIPAAYEQSSKHHNIFLPEWFKPREFYTTSEIFAGFFEQVITVKYILHRQKLFKPRAHLEQILKERKDMKKYLTRAETISPHTKTLMNYVREKKIISSLYDDSNAQTLVMTKLYQNNSYFFFSSNKEPISEADVIFDKTKFSQEEIEKRLEKFLDLFFCHSKGYNNSDSISNFVDKLTFLNIDKVFSFDDLLLRNVYECLNELIQKESYYDLLNDGGVTAGKNSKGKKKKKKKGGVKKNEIEKVNTELELEANCPSKPRTDGGERKYAFSFIKRKGVCMNSGANVKNIQDNNKEIKFDTLGNNYVKKEFLGHIMLIKNQNNTETLEKQFEAITSNENGKADIDLLDVDADEEMIFIRQMVKDIMEEIVSSLCFKLNFEHDYEKDIKDNNLKKKTTTQFASENFITPDEALDRILNDKTNIYVNPTDEEDASNLSNTEMNSPCTKTSDMKNQTITGMAISNKDNVSLSDKNEQNDTDTTYSSDGNSNSNSGKKRGNKKKKNQFFLYNVNLNNKLNKKSNSENVSNNKNIKIPTVKNKTDKKKENPPDKLENLPVACTSNIRSNSDVEEGSNKLNNEYTKNKHQKNNKIFLNSNYNKRKYSNHNNNSNYKNNTYNKYSKVSLSLNAVNYSINDYNNKNYIYPKNYNNSYPKPNGYVPQPDPFFNSGMPINVPFLPPQNFMSPYSSFYNPFGPNDFYIHHNPISLEYFLLKLHKDVLLHYEGTENLLMQLKPFKTAAVTFLEKEIKNFFASKEFNLQAATEIYGSFASELDIETSDIDMSIKFEGNTCNDLDYMTLMKKLVDKLVNMNVFETVSPIYTASVPVIKIVFDPSKVLDESASENFKKFKEVLKNNNTEKFIFTEEDEIEKIKIDLTFQECIKKKNNLNNINFSNNNVPAQHLEFIKNYILVFPEIKPLIKLLKRYLQINKLNCTFNGGLSSFSLFLLLLACVKMHRMNSNTTPINLGKVLVEFFLYCGCFIDFNFTLIDVNMDNPFVICPEPLEIVPTILDPITYINASKSSYKILDLKHLFNSGYDFINEIKSLLDRNLLQPEENIVNILLSKEVN